MLRIRYQIAHLTIINAFVRDLMTKPCLPRAIIQVEYLADQGRISTLGRKACPSWYRQGQGTPGNTRSPFSGGCKKSGGTSAGNCLSSAHFLTSSKFLHLCFVLKSVKGVGAEALYHTWPSTPISTVHINCWRRMSTQWAAPRLSYQEYRETSRSPTYKCAT